MRKKLYFILTALLLNACLDEPDCIRESSSELNISFRSLEDGEPQNLAINTIKLSGSDSVFYDSASISSIILPLDPMAERDTILMDTALGIDTIVFSYNSFTRLISPDCGPETYIQKLKIERHTIDSLRVVNTDVLPGIPVNYAIYF